ncbi:MAG: TrmH family RNA methyltransferase [Bacteroidales bacterium]|nr:TrmH family RNA methyltransferase [Bacteroidales bacterium]MDT8432394.1 TrmH family RNA methyltransferase [Bacteroidales bacterium]
MADPDFCFILYRPAVPGNIGAAARAIKTMGFSELRLVDPADHLSAKAKMMAHGSHDILENSKVYTTYEAAVDDIDFIVCTTAKKKGAKVDYVPSGQLNRFIAEKIPVARRIGIVFGTEESGLPNSILLTADAGVTIPMATTHPSLNLAQSVMVIAYELSGLLHNEASKRPPNQVPGGAQQLPDTAGAPQQQANSETSRKQESATVLQQPETWRQLRERTETILQQAGIRPGTPLYHRILERMSFMKASDARLAHSVTSRVMDLIDQVSRK